MEASPRNDNGAGLGREGVMHSVVSDFGAADQPLHPTLTPLPPKYGCRY